MMIYLIVGEKGGRVELYSTLDNFNSILSFFAANFWQKKVNISDCNESRKNRKRKKAAYKNPYD